MNPNRFLDIYDKNNSPIFEGDKATLDCSTILCRTSELGLFLKSLNDKEIFGVIEFLNTYPELKMTFEITFFYKDKRPVLNQDYYRYCSQKNPDFKGMEDPDKTFAIKNSDPMFFRYVYNTLPMTLIDNNTERNFSYNDVNEYLIKLDNHHFNINETLLIERNDELDTYFKDKISIIKTGDFSHVKVSFEKPDTGFYFFVSFSFVNELGELSTKRKTTKIKTEFEEPYSLALDEFDHKEYLLKQERDSEINTIKEKSLIKEDEIYQINDIKEKYKLKIKELEKEISTFIKENDIYESIDFEPFSLYLDYNSNLNFLNHILSKYEFKRGVK